MKPIKILLIEDSEGDILLTVEALSDSKIVNDIYVLKDGKEAIEFFESNPPAEQLPDLILLDINLPMKSGHEVLSYLKNSMSYRHIAVIMLTTSSSEKDILRAYDSYVNCYITKPIDASDFMDAVIKIEDFWISIVTLPR
ncbi:response regulator [Mucilaginibacter sp. BT774]|uniref:response regulator n=1 Tax=Mucilaginibacter sp. BT774 TaxID=3062276 RepID=UPI0026764391|nr:response regulator [Mucilaginibacter sp. BT774]MDO3625794.1 response regulator [Mucilaginibacter sp. BT774]